MRCAMHVIVSAFLLAMMVVSTWANERDDRPAETDWPCVTKECRPWTYWWWMGSAVNEAELTRHLEDYHKAGIGGVHIIPIYGVTLPPKPSPAIMR